MSELSKFSDYCSSVYNSTVNNVQSGNWLASLRPFSMFLHPNQFERPSSAKDAMQRLRYNVTFFSSNYSLVFLTTFVYAAIFKPLLLILLSVLCVCGYYLITKTEDVVLGEITIPKQNKLVVFAFVSTLVLLAFCGGVLFAVLGVSCAMVCLHGVMHRTAKYEQVSFP